MNDFKFTRSFSEGEMQALTPKIALALTKFPELTDRTIKIGKVLNGKNEGVADVLSGNYMRLASSNVSMHTIGHELTHLIQGESLGRQIPLGEVQADIWTLARDEIFLDESPSYLVDRIKQRIVDQADNVCGYRRCKKVGPANISNVAKNLAFTGFMLGNFGNQEEQVISNIYRNWQEQSETFRKECQNAIELRSSMPSTYIAGLAVNLAQYAINDYIFRQARRIDENGVTRSFVESYKEHEKKLPGTEVLIAMCGGLEKFLRLDKIKSKED